MVSLSLVLETVVLDAEMTAVFFQACVIRLVKLLKARQIGFVVESYKGHNTGGV